jgi:hypothetical protein
MTKRTLCAVLLAAATASAAAQEGAGVPVDVAGLVAALRQGGLVVYFRHTSTDRADIAKEARIRAAGELDIANCLTQRNLSLEGHAEAREQAAIFRRLGIPMGDVLASRYCRAYQHALAFTPAFAYSEPVTPVRNPEKARALKRMLATPPAPGTNTLVFAHGGILWEATDYDSVESETFVFRPGTPPKLEAAIRMEDWARLARGTGTCCAPRAFWRGGAPAE